MSMTKDSNTCALYGHHWTLFSDGSKKCGSCGVYIGPGLDWNAAKMRAAYEKAEQTKAPVQPPAVKLMTETSLYTLAIVGVFAVAGAVVLIACGLVRLFMG